MRDALLFSDGSLTIFAEGWPMEQIRQERADADKHEDRLHCLTKIVRVQYSIEEVVFDPAMDPPAAKSEIDRLRAENAALRARLGHQEREGSPP